MPASFTGHTLPILANWAQAASGIFFVTGLAAFYARHKCHHCKRLARFQVGEHRVPVCHRHRAHEMAAG